MLTIRGPQMEALGAGRMHCLAERLAAHAWQYFPKEAEQLGEKGVLLEAKNAISRARGHGVTAERSICKFFNLRMALGREFEEEEWAGRILAYSAAGPIKMELLYEEAMRRTGELR